MIYNKAPHDSFFGHMMEKKNLAKSFFMSQLPQAINEALNWDTLQIAESARRNPGRKTRYTDITYSCRLKEEDILIYLHGEQERSDKIPKMIARILGYNAGLITQCLRQGSKKVPLIINFILYNNPRASTETYPTHSWDYSEVPWMHKLLYDKYFFLLNVKQTPDITLADCGPSGFMSLLLKRTEEHNFEEWLKSHGRLIKQLMEDIALSGIASDDIFDLSLSYIVTVAKDKSEDLLDTFKALFPQYNEKIMTVAKQLERKGEIIGKRKGEIIGKRKGEIIGEMMGKKEVAKNMIRGKEPLDKIIKWTGLSREEVEKMIEVV
jgi:predicted transposase/invertase (TIGR01784 family)